MSFAPTDLRYGQNIINNYLATLEAQQRGRQLDLEQQRLEQEHEEQNKRIELIKSAQDFSQTIQKHDLAQKYIDMGLQGTPPPGGSIDLPNTTTPSAGSGMSPISTTLGLGVNQQRINLPPELGMPPVTTLNPQAAAELKGRLGAAEAEPKALLESAKQAEIARRELTKEMMILTQKTSQDEADRASREAIAREETRRALGVANLSKMSALQNSMLESTVNKFDTNSAVRDYETLKLANATAQGDPSDMELLTAYHKALNPALAATPEYAYTLPQTLPSFAERLGLKFDNITNPKQFIPNDMKDDLKRQINNRFKLQEQAYNNFRQGEVQKLQQFGISNPDSLLTDHSKNVSIYGPIEEKTLKSGAKVQVRLNKVTGRYEDASTNVK